VYRFIPFTVAAVIIAGAIGYAIGRSIDDRPAPVTPVAALSATDTPTLVSTAEPTGVPSLPR